MCLKASELNSDKAELIPSERQGIIVFIAVIYQFFKLLFRAYIDTDDKETKIYTIAFMASISGFLVQSLFDYTFYNYRVMIFFWIYIALGAVATKYASLKGE